MRLSTSTFVAFMLFKNALSEECSDNYAPKIYPQLLGLEQDDPVLIEAIRNEVLIPPPPASKKLNMKKKKMNWKELRGQFGQVDFVLSTGKKKAGIEVEKGGFFIEAGASDGEELSNTLYLEKKHKVREYTILQSMMNAKLSPPLTLP